MANASLLESLLRLCFAAVQASNEEIRRVHREGHDSYCTTLKDEEDPRTCVTVADARAQVVLLSILRSRFPLLTIIAEEDDQPVAANSSANSHSTSEFLQVPVDLGVLLEDLPDEYQYIEEESLCVYIDPLDGTREFVEGRLQSCQTLLGIAWNGRPVAGVVGLPFHHGHIGHIPQHPPSASGLVYIAVVGKGIYPALTPAPGSTFSRRTGVEPSDSDEMVLGVSSSVAKGEEVLNEVIKVMNASSLLRVGGCGNKAMHVLTGAADAALFNLRTSRWDTCATAAFLSAIGGSVMTLGGFPIAHGRVLSEAHSPARSSFHAVTDPSELANPYGVLLLGPSVDPQEIANKLRALPCLASLFTTCGFKLKLTQDGSAGASAIDIARLIDGEPFDLDTLEKLLGVKGQRLVGYSAMEHEAIRYKQSHACRIRLEYADVDQDGSAEGPRSFFYKRSVLRELPRAMEKARIAPFKLARDVKSMQVESAVLKHPVSAEFSEKSSVTLPVAYRAELFVVKDVPLESRFTCMLRDFSPEDGWVQSALLEKDRMRLVLEGLAEWHAFFWIGDGSVNISRRIEGVWPVGSYLQLSHQPAGQIEAIPASWQRFRKDFAKELEETGVTSTALETLGDRLHAQASAAADAVHVLKSKYITLIHGDAKPSNMFFNVNSNALGMIDFQWAGKGLPGTDVAYCIAAGVDGVAQVEQDIGEFLDWCIDAYWTRFNASLVRFGVAHDQAIAESILPLEELRKQVHIGMLDLARVVICDHWKPVTPEVLKRREGHLVYNSYNKSIPAAMWMIRTIDYLLLPQQ